MNDPHEQRLEEIILRVEKDPASAALDAMEYAEQRFASPLDRLHAVCIAMEGFSLLGETQHVKILHEIAVRMNECLQPQTKIAESIMVRAKELMTRNSKDASMAATLDVSGLAASLPLARPLTPVTTKANEGTPSTQRSDNSDIVGEQSNWSTPASSLGQSPLPSDPFK